MIYLQTARIFNHGYTQPFGDGPVAHAARRVNDRVMHSVYEAPWLAPVDEKARLIGKCVMGGWNLNATTLTTQTPMTSDLLYTHGPNTLGKAAIITGKVAGDVLSLDMIEVVSTPAEALTRNSLHSVMMCYDAQGAIGLGERSQVTILHPRTPGGLLRPMATPMKTPPRQYTRRSGVRGGCSRHSWNLPEPPPTAAEQPYSIA